MKDGVTWDDFYFGSRKFQFIADASGLPIDQINFLLGQIMCLIFGYLYRKMLHPCHTSSVSRHSAALLAGLFVSYFCFGKQVILAIFLALMCYSILIMVPISSSHYITLFASISFLSIAHIQRQIYEDGIFVIGVTGPMMIMVQKCTALAYSLNDGSSSNKKQLTTLQQKYLLRSMPSMLEYFSYLLCFQSVLAGPYFAYSDYQDFIDGTNYLKIQTMNKNADSGCMEIDRNANNNVEDITKLHAADPSPTRAVIWKMLVSLICSLLVACVCPLVPISHITEPSFLSGTLSYQLGYILLTTTMARQLYYTGWYLADAVCNISGFGFSGYNSHGQPMWGLVSNVDLLGVELGTSLKTTLESWNIGTMQWLRFLVYDRVSIQKTLATYFLSSLWHGFYPGYYLTFLGGAFFTICARTVRRSIRHRVLTHGSRAHLLYDVFTSMTTRLCLCYITFPFVLLRFWGSLQVYFSLWFFLHICGLFVLLTLPRIFTPLLRESKVSLKTL